MRLAVEWTERNGHAVEYNWIQDGPDFQHSGVVVGFVRGDGGTLAVIQEGASLVEIYISDLTVTEPRP